MDELMTILTNLTNLGSLLLSMVTASDQREESPNKPRPASEISNTKTSTKNRKNSPSRVGDHGSATSIHRQSLDLRQSVEDSQQNDSIVDQYRTGGSSDHDVLDAAALPTAQPGDIHAADMDPEIGLQQSKAGRRQKLQTELQLAKKTIDTLNKEKKSILAELHNAVDDLHYLQSERDCRIADEVFLSSWLKLRYDIKNWAATYFTGKPRNTRFRRSRPDFSRLSSDHKTFMQSENYRYLLVQAFLWQQLIENVFDGSCNGLYWADQTHSELRSIQNRLNPRMTAPSNAIHHSKDALKARAHDDNSLKEYHTWRAKTTQLLLAQGRSLDYMNNRINGLVGKLSYGLRPYAESLDGKIDRPLKDIVAAAVDLDSKMNTQKAVFTPKLYFEEERCFGISFDCSSMESIDGTLGCSTGSVDKGENAQNPPPELVELVVSPALLKTGNSMAEDYQTHHVLVKAQVLCHQLMLIRDKN